MQITSLFIEDLICTPLFLFPRGFPVLEYGSVCLFSSALDAPLKELYEQAIHVRDALCRLREQVPLLAGEPRTC